MGRIGAGPEAELFGRYSARLRPRLVVTEIADGHGNPVEIKRREAAALLAAVPSNAFTVPLDLAGVQMSSETLASKLQSWRETGRAVCFIIGGAEGLDGPVMTRADFVLSIGAMTWPHILVRVMLAEQLFRAQSISANHPYHRAGRPSVEKHSR